ncbi:MAG TPA: response regulator [Rariglobus sp.]|jgi:CheY-like chemotaxis protein|nr:response regulator [Rariglobus sp.]
MARILVIDDYPPVLDVLRIVLRVRGHEVITADNGPAGLRLCECHAFDLALLDVDMPGMGGIAVCNELKGHVMTRHLPVLMMTGRPGMDADIRAKRAGALEVISKPFEVRELLDKISRYATPPTAIPLRPEPPDGFAVRHSC